MHRLHTLPDSFYSDETGQPFEACCDCGEPLAESPDGHIIQKAYAKGETIMEIAICVKCHDGLQESYSKESRESIWNFYLDHADLPGRLKKFSELPVGQPDFWINRCVTCGTLRNNAPEYVVAAQCIDGDLVYGETPLMMCLECTEKVVGLLSEASRDTYDRWMDRVNPPAPSTADDTPRVRVFI